MQLSLGDLNVGTLCGYHDRPVILMFFGHVNSHKEFLWDLLMTKAETRYTHPHGVLLVLSPL